MSGYAIAIAAAAGAIAALVAALLVRKPREKRVEFVVLFVVLLGGLNVVGQQFLLPRLDPSIRVGAAEKALLEIPAFQAIKQHDPATYATILAELRAGLARGLEEDQLIAQVKPKVEQLVVERLPKASDPALVAYIRTMVQELRELNRKDPNLCYQFLFPQQYGALNASQHLSPEILQADLAALVQVIETSARAPQSPPPAEEVAADLQAAVGALEQQHGAGAVAALQNLHDPAVPRAKGCALTADLYDHVLALPPERSGKVLRFMFSQV